MRKSFLSGKVLGLWHSPVTTILKLIIVKSTTIGKRCLKNILFVLVINVNFGAGKKVELFTVLV